MNKDFGHSVFLLKQAKTFEYIFAHFLDRPVSTLRYVLDSFCAETSPEDYNLTSDEAYYVLNYFKAIYGDLTNAQVCFVVMSTINFFNL